MNWLKDNQLTINVKKTNYILFKSPKKQTQKNIKIFRNDYELKQVENCKFLGVIIDENLTWKQHMLYMTDKIAKSTGILSKIRHYISNNLLITLYYTLIYPYLYYANIVWANNYTTRLEKILKIQKKAIRIIIYSPYNSPSLPLFKKLKILNINQINDLHISLFMFDIHNNDLPLLVNELFKANRNVHDHNTQSANKLHKRYNRTNYGWFSLSSKGIDKWNETPEKIKKASSRNIFKREIQKLFAINHWTQHSNWYTVSQPTTNIHVWCTGHITFFIDTDTCMISYLLSTSK